MALKRSGVLLVAEGYSTYRQQMRELNKLHKQAFDQSAVKGYSRSSREFVTSSQRMKASAKSTWDVVSNLRNAFNSASQGAAGLGSSTNTAASWLDRLRGPFSGATGGSSGLISGLGGLITKLTAVGFAVKGAMDIVNFVKASGDVAQAAETMNVALNEVGTAVGYSSEQIQLATNLLKDQGITTTVAQKSLLRMARANISWAEASKLASIAQGSAVIAGMNSSEAFERLVTGIQKMEPELLDELGITLQREQAYKKFAAAMDLNAKELTTAQKQQAILNSIYEQSEVVIGVYDAAMETTGKQQASLARHIEETQLSIGKLILPFKAASVEMKTNFWKGLRVVAQGLETWAPLIKVAIDGVKQMAGAIIGVTPAFQILEKMTSGSGGVFETMGRGAHQWARVTVEAAVFIAATFEKTWETLKGFGKQAAKLWEALNTPLSEGGLQKTWEALTEDIDFGKPFKESFSEIHDEAKKAFPDVFKSWEELTKTVEGTSEDLRLPGEEGTEEAVENVDELKESLENLISVYQRLDDINRKFNEDVAKLHADNAKEIAKATEDLAKAIQKAEEKKADALKKLDQDTAKERSKLIDDFNRRRAQEERKRNREIEFEMKRHQLAMLQAQRRFQLDDRRLRAEGDILGLMELRENFELEQMEAKENFALAQEEAKAANEEEDTIAQEELDRQLEELDEKAEEERKRIQEAYDQEMEDLKTQNQAKMEEIAKNLEERFNALVEGRNKELEELGRSLQDEGQITQEGMQEIAGHIGGVFGPGGASDAFIKGWSSRTESEFGKLIQELKQELKELEDAAESAASAAQSASSGGGGGSGGVAGKPSAFPQAIPMRHGGSGVVRGPAHFFVEPGVKEHVAFTPLASGGGGSMRHSGNVDMGLNVSGLPSGLNEQLTEAIINKAADLTVDEIVIAVERMKRRTG